MEEKSFDYMNVIPLVDVMLVLLTIVLTTSSFLVAGAIPVALPKASSAHDEARRAHTVIIDAVGGIYFNSSPVSLDGLRGCLAPLDRASPVHVTADKSITVQSCVDVLDLLAGQGFTKVSLRTEKREDR